eukprot:CAMPEP_0170615622 /NCGR_PEP_ID=MMETSP0224-20130122/25438_1 /TAXON_ID=285029 /ORGANISM="Togula jolla, Strain CCCM 725" /LENGTH=48 /DNA_ID= /DNA_START= /DNA_END= /DNA_ORIENTATION=
MERAPSLCFSMSLHSSLGLEKSKTAARSRESRESRNLAATRSTEAWHQ